MTDMSKPVTRRTCAAYRVTISGAFPCASGRRLVATLTSDQAGDWLEIREAGRRYRVRLDVAELYRRGMLAEVAREKAERQKAKHNKRGRR